MMNKSIGDLSIVEFKGLLVDSIYESMKQINTKSPPLSVEDVARLTRLSPKTIYNLVQTNRIPYFRRSRRLYFDEKEILQWLHGQEKNKATPD